MTASRPAPSGAWNSLCHGGGLAGGGNSLCRRPTGRRGHRSLPHHSRPTTAAMSAWIRARRLTRPCPGVTRSAGGSGRAARDRRAALLRAIWSTRSTRSASLAGAPIGPHTVKQEGRRWKNRCHAVAWSGCAGSAKSRTGGRCGQGRSAGDSHGARGPVADIIAHSWRHPLAVGAHLRDELMTDAPHR